MSSAKNLIIELQIQFGIENQFWIILSESAIKSEGKTNKNYPSKIDFDLPALLKDIAENNLRIVNKCYFLKK